MIWSRPKHSTANFSKWNRMSTAPYYVGYRVGDLEVGLDPNASGGPIAYVDVEDIRASLAGLTSTGAEVVQDVRDVGNGLLIAQVKDAGGNVVGLRQPS